MKSLNFNKVSFQTQDVLSRTQMKNILVATKVPLGVKRLVRLVTK